MQLHVGGFKPILTAIEKIKENELADELPEHRKQLLIRTPQEGLYIKVDSEKLNSLIDLLNTSIYMYEVKNLIAG